MTKNNPICELDGKALYYTFIAGSKRLIEKQIEINSINVFPVNDEDTGTNLASTIRSVLDNLSPNGSYKNTITNIAELALIGARGNSGVIFAQFLFGMSMETRDKDKINLNEFALSIHNAVRYMYEAVAIPMEGTMLTVIKDWAHFIYGEIDKQNDFNQLLVDSQPTLRQSLAETTQKLAILNENHVVDAGALGMVVFLEGIIDFILNPDLRKLRGEMSPALDISHISESGTDVSFRYCSEAILRNLNIPKATLSDTLKKHGDSIVVAGSEKIARIHVHTNHPSTLFSELSSLGTISMQKVDDIQRQYEIAHHRKWNIALVTDSTCDLSEEFLDKYQIHVIPLNILFGENQYLDKVTLSSEEFYKLIDSSTEFPTSSQVNERAFVNLYSNLASHYDAIIAIHLTQKFSGTYLNSLKAAGKISNEFNKPIHVFDSKTLSGALGLVVLRTAQGIESGTPLPELVSLIDQWINRTQIYVSVKTLKYMVKGGRVSYTKGAIAKLFNINPIVSMDENGKSMVFGKAFSHRSNMKKVMKQVEVLSKNNKIWNYIILHANNEEGAHWFAEAMKKLSGKNPISLTNISPVIGMNAGVGATSIALLID